MGFEAHGSPAGASVKRSKAHQTGCSETGFLEKDVKHTDVFWWISMHFGMYHCGGIRDYLRRSEAVRGDSNFSNQNHVCDFKTADWSAQRNILATKIIVFFTKLVLSVTETAILVVSILNLRFRFNVDNDDFQPLRGRWFRQQRSLSKLAQRIIQNQSQESFWQRQFSNKLSCQ